MAVVTRVVDVLSQGSLSRFVARLAGIEADVERHAREAAKQGEALDAQQSRLQAIEDDHRMRLAALERQAAEAEVRLQAARDTSMVFEARLVFIERLLGAAADKPDGIDGEALETVLDQRLAYCEGRLLAILNGSYLERVRAIAREEARS